MTALPPTGLCMRFGSILVLAVALPLFTPFAHAQNAPSQHTSPDSSLATYDSGFVDTTGMDAVKDRMMRNMARQRDELRQKAIVDDTNQLLDLAQQLKTAVDKTDKDRLSLSVVHTAAQIEKLAKAVEKKMREGD